MTDQTYQAPPPQIQQPQYQQQSANIYDHFVGSNKLGLFLLLGAGAMALGALILDMCFSGMLDGDIRAIIFLGEMLLDIGIIAILSLLLIGGIIRTDLAETIRSHMLRAAGFGLGLYVLAWAIRIMYGGVLGSIMF